MDIREEALDLANLINDFCRDYDPYDYDDNVDNPIDEIIGIKDDLLDNKAAEVLEYLNSCNENMEDSDTMKGTCVYLIGRINSFVKMASNN